MAPHLQVGPLWGCLVSLYCARGTGSGVRTVSACPLPVAMTMCPSALVAFPSLPQHCASPLGPPKPLISRAWGLPSASPGAELEGRAGAGQPWGAGTHCRGVWGCRGADVTQHPP